MKFVLSILVVMSVTSFSQASEKRIMTNAMLTLGDSANAKVTLFGDAALALRNQMEVTAGPNETKTIGDLTCGTVTAADGGPTSSYCEITMSHLMDGI